MHTYLITGAGSGIGAGLAAELAGPGRHIVLSDVTVHKAEPLARQLRDRGLSAQAIELDVTSDASVETGLARLTREQTIDVLINNAGIQFVSELEQFPITKWDQLIQIMLTGVARLTRVVLPGMRARNFGRIVNIGIIHSLVASPYKSAYVAAKHGLLGFSKAIALETASADITVNTICPSYVKTPLVDAQITAQASVRGMSEAEVIERVMLQPMPKGAFIGFDELAGVVTFLVSSVARNITGQTIVIDGGWTAQ